MVKVSLNRLGGGCLIGGPLLAAVCFLVELGGLLIETADRLDPEEAALALASNPVLTDITALAIAMGLALALFGLYVVQRRGRTNDGGHALTLLGFFFVAIGIAGAAITQGVNHVVADTLSVAAVLPVFQVSMGVGLTAGLFVGVGFLALSLGLPHRGNVNRPIVLVVALVSAASLVCLVIGVVAPAESQLTNLILVLGVANIAWAAWTVALGIGLVRATPGLNRLKPAITDRVVEDVAMLVQSSRQL